MRDFDVCLSYLKKNRPMTHQIERGSWKCLQKSTWEEGGPKSPKTCLRSLWMAPNVNTYSPVHVSGSVK